MQKTLSDDEHIYSKDNIFAVVKAAKELTDRAFKVYVRLNLNKNGFVSPLSPAWLKKEIGINSDKCRRAINELIEKGYLKRSDKQSNYYTFFELPTADLQVHTADLQEGYNKSEGEIIYNTTINNKKYNNDNEYIPDIENLEELSNILSDSDRFRANSSNKPITPENDDVMPWEQEDY